MKSRILAVIFEEISIWFAVFDCNSIATFFLKYGYYFGDADVGITYSGYLLDLNNPKKHKLAIDVLHDILKGDKFVAEAKNNLACAYGEGLGVEKNLKTALYWHDEAIKNGLKYTDEEMIGIEKLRNDLRKASSGLDETTKR